MLSATLYRALLRAGRRFDHRKCFDNRVLLSASRNAEYDMCAAAWIHLQPVDASKANRRGAPTLRLE